MVSNHSQRRAAHFAHAVIVRGMTFAAALIVASVALPVWAQLPVEQGADIAGSWTPTRTESMLERTAGPVGGDYTGIPYNEAGVALGKSYAADMLGEPERTCQLYNQWEQAEGAAQLRFWPMTAGPVGKVVAWEKGPFETMAPMMIWMNGEAPPSKYLDFPRGGFTVGRWQGNMLIAHTTQLKMGQMRHNGGFNSDRASMDSIFIPHGEMLTAVWIMNDPVYLTQPFVYSYLYTRSVARPVAAAYPPCIVNYEGVPEGDVPYYMPGKNSLTDQMMQIYHIPVYASQGGADTMYPAIRDKMKAQFLKLYPSFSKKCTLYCSSGRPAAAPPRAAGSSGASAGGGR